MHYSIEVSSAIEQPLRFTIWFQGRVFTSFELHSLWCPPRLLPGVYVLLEYALCNSTGLSGSNVKLFLQLPGDKASADWLSLLFNFYFKSDGDIFPGVSAVCSLATQRLVFSRQRVRTYASTLNLLPSRSQRLKEASLSFVKTTCQDNLLSRKH